MIHTLVQDIYKFSLSRRTILGKFLSSRRPKSDTSIAARVVPDIAWIRKWLVLLQVVHSSALRLQGICVRLAFPRGMHRSQQGQVAATFHSSSFSHVHEFEGGYDSQRVRGSRSRRQAVAPASYGLLFCWALAKDACCGRGAPTVPGTFYYEASHIT